MEAQPPGNQSAPLAPEAIVPGLNLQRVAKDPRVGTSRSFGRNDQLNFSSYAIEYLMYDDESGEKLEYLRNLIKDSPVVDLGAGEDADSYKLACLLGASGYIAVEPFAAEALTEKLNEVGREKIKLKLRRTKDGNRADVEVEVDPIKFSVVPTDALGFMRAVPDNSVNIFSFGVDDTILKDGRYIDEAREELSRALREEGAFVGEETVLNPVRGKRDFSTERGSSKGYSMKITRVKSKSEEAANS